jgi:hypothetical protein
VVFIKIIHNSTGTKLNIPAPYAAMLIEKIPVLIGI